MTARGSGEGSRRGAWPSGFVLKGWECVGRLYEGPVAAIVVARRKRSTSPGAEEGEQHGQPRAAEPSVLDHARGTRAWFGGSNSWVGT
jgi:hypothetical protein